MHIRSVLTHSAQAILEGALIATLVVGLMAGTAFAGRPSTGGTTTTSTALAVKMQIDRNGDGSPNWNDQITFKVSTTATDKPWVLLNCYQNGDWVSTMSHGFFDAYPWAPVFTLASGAWTSGAADCTATLYKLTSNGRERDLAAIKVHVDG